jgi:hypothetical protein
MNKNNCIRNHVPDVITVNREKVKMIDVGIFELSADRCQIEFEAADRMARFNGVIRPG